MERLPFREIIRDADVAGLLSDIDIDRIALRRALVEVVVHFHPLSTVAHRRRTPTSAGLAPERAGKQSGQCSASWGRVECTCGRRGGKSVRHGFDPHECGGMRNIPCRVRTGRGQAERRQADLRNRAFFGSTASNASRDS